MTGGWNHRSFGAFTRKGSTFSTTLTVPAFQRFSYDTGYSNARRSTGKVGLSFGPWMANEELPEPTPEMVKVAEKALADPDKFVDSVAHGLWEEFSGRGPTNGYWWYSNLDSVGEHLLDSGLPKPERPQDVLLALQLTAIRIFTQIDEYPHPVAYLEFHAAFEEEHGFCVVSDGERVLGTAYSGEPAIAKTVNEEKD